MTLMWSSEPHHRVREALYLANLRYERGLSTYLEVLDQERQLFRAELDLASSTRDQLTVYKALGGGWER